MSSFVQNLVRRGSIVLVLQVSGQALMFLSHAMLARIGGPAEYGAFAITFAFISTLLIFSRLGQDLNVLREFPRLIASKSWARLRGLWVSANSIVFVAGAAASVLMVSVAAIPSVLPARVSVSVALIGAATLIMMALNAIRFNALLAFDRPVRAYVGEVLIRPAALLALVSLAAIFMAPPSTLTMVAFLCFASLIAISFSEFSVRKTWPGTAEGREVTGIREPLKTGFGLLVATGAYQALTQIDTLFVGIVLDEVNAGYYAAASRLSMVVQFGLLALQYQAAPQLSRYYAERDMVTMQAILTKVAVISTVFAFVGSIVVVVAAEPIMLLFGPGFDAGADVLRIFVISHVINAATGVTGWLLLMAGYQKIVAIITIVGLCIQVAGLLLLAPVFGLPGAAVATVSALIAVHIAMAMFAWRVLRLRTFIGA